MRASVDLPEPNSPTSASVSPRPMLKETSATARSSARRSPASTRSSHGLETSNVRVRPRASTSGGCAHASAPAGSTGGSA